MPTTSCTSIARLASHLRAHWLVYFVCHHTQLPIYLRIGGRAVGPPFIMPNDIAARYGKQWQVCQLMESGTYVDKDKQADARAKTKSKSKL